MVSARDMCFKPIDFIGQALACVRGFCEPHPRLAAVGELDAGGASAGDDAGASSGS